MALLGCFCTRKGKFNLIQYTKGKVHVSLWQSIMNSRKLSPKCQTMCYPGSSDHCTVNQLVSCSSFTSFHFQTSDTGIPLRILPSANPMLIFHVTLVTGVYDVHKFTIFVVYSCDCEFCDEVILQFTTVVQYI
jgi:hypothetical protein